MLGAINIHDILFLDIETVPGSPSYEMADEKLQKLWEKKSSYFRNEEEAAGDVYARAGIYAEFGRIICISVGVLTHSELEPGIRLTSYADDDEGDLLKDFALMLTSYSKNKSILLCAHNGKEFDFPYIARRMLINGLPLPGILDIAGKKPWEVMHLDTMELWKFGDYKHYTSLELLTHIFNIPSPKQDIDGSQVGEVYYKDHDLDRIVRYCQNDVVAIVQLLLRYKGMNLIPGNRIKIVDHK